MGSSGINLAIDYEALEDAKLVLLVQQGDRGAFHQITRHSREVS